MTPDSSWSAPVDAALSERVVATARTVLIDGRSGSGKTELARRVRDRVALLSGRRVTLVRMDDLYPGWHGLRAGSLVLSRDLLRPRSRGDVGRWQGWDWDLSRPAASHSLERGGVLIVEGCGALTRASAAYADLTVWASAPEADRRQRALRRDGDAFRPWWETWARQEVDHIRLHRPDVLADVALDSAGEQWRIRHWR